MNIRIILTAALLAAFALSTYALSPEHVEWGQGPAQFLMTKDEAARWKSLESDTEAQAFVDLFWARRDPTPDTPRNEFREAFDARVDFADKNFASGRRMRGAMSDRGKVFILFGQPKRVERSGGKPEVSPMGDPGAAVDVSTPMAMFQFTYDDQEEIFGTEHAIIRFADRSGTGAYVLDRGPIDIGRAQQHAIEKAITQPNLTAAPTFDPAVATAAPMAAAPEPAAVQTELSTESLTSAVAAMKSAAKNPYDKGIVASWGEFVTSAGTYFVPVMLYVPKAAGLPAEGLTFFGVVQDESGKNVLAFEEPSALTATKDDFFVEKTLMGLPGGKLRGTFGLAANGMPVAMTAADMTLAGTLDKDAEAISRLILSNNVYPLPEAQEATDPFAFGGVKVIPKADKTFRTSDELWYFFELRHPGLADVPAPAGGAAAGETSQMPKIQVKIDIEGTNKEGKKVKMSAPPAEVGAIEMKGVPGHYGVGSAIPLESFKPGDYKFTIKVIDTVKKSSQTLSDTFKVVE